LGLGLLQHPVELPAMTNLPAASAMTSFAFVPAFTVGVSGVSAPVLAMLKPSTTEAALGFSMA
jgi:hypothetical protein